MAQLRMLRGGSTFIQRCAAELERMGAEGVLSPPLSVPNQRVWKEAEFAPRASLELLRLSLGTVKIPDHRVSVGSRADLPEALRIDTEAFSAFWQFDMEAMREALQATPVSQLHVVRGITGLAGFAVTGIGTRDAYLQRLAVDPAYQRCGIGSSLVRTAADWARRKGARSLLLNTQPDNDPALSLYHGEGFRTLADRMHVLQK